MKAPTGRNMSVSVSEKAISGSGTPKSLAIVGRAMTTRKKSKASNVQPRNPARTAKDRLAGRDGRRGPPGILPGIGLEFAAFSLCHAVLLNGSWLPVIGCIVSDQPRRGNNGPSEKLNSDGWQVTMSA